MSAGTIWFDFWVNQLWGGVFISIIGSGLVFSFIGLIGKMGFLLLTTMLVTFFLVFLLFFSGLGEILAVFLFAFSIYYFGNQIFKSFRRE